MFFFSPDAFERDLSPIDLLLKVFLVLFSFHNLFLDGKSCIHLQYLFVHKTTPSLRVKPVIEVNPVRGLRMGQQSYSLVIIFDPLFDTRPKCAN